MRLNLAQISFAFFICLSASAQPVPLSETLQSWFSLQVQLGQCQSHWVENQQDYQWFDLAERNAKLLAVPCAQWGHNLRWSLFFITTDSESTTLSYSKPLYFSHASGNQGLTSAHYVENFRFNPETGELVSRTYKNGKPHCGELARYSYQADLQQFELTDLLHNQDCSDPNAEWVTLLGN
jgi:hypothetical protein